MNEKCQITIQKQSPIDLFKLIYKKLLNYELNLKKVIFIFYLNFTGSESQISDKVCNKNEINCSRALNFFIKDSRPKC